MNLNPERAPGRITTFYSYKGGTGRSMLLANVAMVLASNDRKVAIIDWDLEAPGLHRYFRPFMVDPDLSSTLGLIDMLTGYWDQLIEFNARSDPPPQGWEQRFLDIYRYAVTLILPASHGERRIVLVPAGRQYSGYATKVSAFDWDAFYSDAGGRGFVEALAQRLRGEFDHVLIDSRTGVSDTAGICTIHLPDDLVVCFTYNNQSMLGASGVATFAAASRRAVIEESSKQRGTPPNETGSSATLRPLRVLPVPTRADYQLPDLLNPRRELAQQIMAWAVADLSPEGARKYWSDVEVPYLPIHSYFETLACLTDRPDDRHSMLEATQNLVRRITDGTVQKWIPMFSEDARQRLRETMQGTLPVVATTSATANPGVGWTEPEIDAAWPVLLRLFRDPDDGEGIGYRTVPAAVLDHLSRKVNELIQRGLLIVRTGNGGASLLELSSLARGSAALLQERFAAQRMLNQRLLDIENVAGRWQASGGRDRSLLKGKRWLAETRTELEELRLLGALSPAETLYLVASGDYQRVQTLSRLRTILVVLAVVPLALLGWQYNKFVEESQALNTKLQGLGAAVEAGLTEANLLRTKFELASTQSEALRLQLQAIRTTQSSSAPLKSCRDKTHGVESYGKTDEVDRVSPWMGGGFSQGPWCDQVIADLRRKYADGDFNVMAKSETSKNTCAPFNCPNYQYRCKVRVRTDPIYAEKASPACK